MAWPLTVGILGGGQLARMTAQAAYRLGLRVAILEREPDSPACQIASVELLGSFEDERLLRRLAELSHVITLENEFVDAGVLERLEALGALVYPTSRTLAVVQDKLCQKEALLKSGIPVPVFAAVSRPDEIEGFGERFGWPLLLKARRGGYDGRGNFLIKSSDEIEKAWGFLRNETLMAEAFVPFERELAVMIARNTKGQMISYPVVETIQRDHICHMVKAPARIPPELAERVQRIARLVVQAVDGVGVFGVELFLTKDGGVLINELAPRPHNSGHYTIEACVTSQFENHLRAVLGWPSGSTKMVAPAAVMINLLGSREGPACPEGLEEALAVPGAHIHIYGKRQTRRGRKMGHVTVVGESIEAALEAAQRAVRALSI